MVFKAICPRDDTNLWPVGLLCSRSIKTCERSSDVNLSFLEAGLSGCVNISKGACADLHLCGLLGH